jgi:predicted PurR-regulated permease PerM
MGTASFIAGMGQLVVVIALVYFLLVAGDSFRRTLIRISGDTLTKKKITVLILDEIDLQIQRYLLVQIVSSALLALVAWVAFAWIGLDNALFWACVGGVLHLIPYAGPTALVVATALVAYVQFDTLQPVAVVVGVTLALVGVIGFLLVPWLTQRTGRIKSSRELSSSPWWVATRSPGQMRCAPRSGRRSLRRRCAREVSPLERRKAGEGVVAPIGASHVNDYGLQ